MTPRLKVAIAMLLAGLLIEAAARSAVSWQLVALGVAFLVALTAETGLGLARRRLELEDERAKAVEALAKRFEDVEKTANTIKVEWYNTRATQGPRR